MEDLKLSPFLFIFLFLASLLFLIIAIFFDLIAGTYVTKVGGVAASDLVLDNIPTMDLDFVFTWGSIIIVVILFLYPLFFRVKEVHKVISQFSLLIMVRAAFTCFTHLGMPSKERKMFFPSLKRAQYQAAKSLTSPSTVSWDTMESPLLHPWEIRS